MTLHVLAPCNNVFLIGVIDLNIQIDGNMFGEQLLFLQYISFVDVSFALTATWTYLIEKWCWVFQIDLLRLEYRNMF